MGRKSRAKAEHRATRATMPDREARPTDPVGWPRRPDLDVGLPPDRQSSLTQGSPPGLRQAPTSPPRVVPSRPERRSQRRTSSWRCSWLVAPPPRRHLSTRSAHYSVKGSSWTDIGRVLGLSRQGARQRYHRLLASNGFSSGPMMGRTDTDLDEPASGECLLARGPSPGYGSGKRVSPRSTRWASVSRLGERSGQGCRAEADTGGKGLSPRPSPSRAGAGHRPARTCGKPATSNLGVRATRGTSRSLQNLRGHPRGWQGLRHTCTYDTQCHRGPCPASRCRRGHRSRSPRHRAHRGLRAGPVPTASPHRSCASAARSRSQPRTCWSCSACPPNRRWHLPAGRRRIEDRTTGRRRLSGARVDHPAVRLPRRFRSAAGCAVPSPWAAGARQLVDPLRRAAGDGRATSAG